MAAYTDTMHVKETKVGIRKYNRIWYPGEKPEHAGIYRCQSCGYEDVINRECEKFPPCSNCEKKNHDENQWKLLVLAEDGK